MKLEPKPYKQHISHSAKSVHTTQIPYVTHINTNNTTSVLLMNTLMLINILDLHHN